MKTKQIGALFFYNLIIWSVGAGLLPLLPLYAEKLSTDPSVVGDYLAVAYLALAVGALSAGWVSDRFRRRKLPMLIVGMLAMPITWMLGTARGIVSLTILTAVLWFCGGMGLALAAILTGLSAGTNERGKIFGILSLTSGLGTAIGGLSTGFLADHWGYPVMFTVVAGFIVLWPASTLLLSEKETAPAEITGGTVRSPGLGRPFLLLFSASLISAITGFIVVLVRSLLMNELGFGATAIASTGAVAGLVTLPLPLLTGWLSDRKGRKSFLCVGYLIGAASVIILAFSTALWHFWVFALGQSLSSSLTAPVGSALAIDILPPQALGKGLGIFGAAGWIGGILGFAGGGYALKSFGLDPTLVLAVSLTLLATALIIPVRSRTYLTDKGLS